VADSITPAVQEMEESLKNIDKVLTSSAKETFLLKRELIGINKILGTKNWEILSRFLSGTGAWRVLNKFKASILMMVQLASIQERASLAEAENMKRMASVAKDRNELLKIEKALRDAQSKGDAKAIAKLEQMSDLFSGTALIHGTSKALTMMSKRVKEQIKVMEGVVGSLGGKGATSSARYNAELKNSSGILESNTLQALLLSSGFAVNAYNLIKLNKNNQVTNDLLIEQTKAYDKMEQKADNLWQSIGGEDSQGRDKKDRLVEYRDSEDNLQTLGKFENTEKGLLEMKKAYFKREARHFEFGMKPTKEMIEETYSELIRATKNWSFSLTDVINIATGKFTGFVSDSLNMNYEGYVTDKEEFEKILAWKEEERKAEIIALNHIASIKKAYHAVEAEGYKEFEKRMYENIGTRQSTDFTEVLSADDGTAKVMDMKEALEWNKWYLVNKTKVEEKFNKHSLEIMNVYKDKYLKNLKDGEIAKLKALGYLSDLATDEQKAKTMKRLNEQNDAIGELLEYRANFDDEILADTIERNNEQRNALNQIWSGLGDTILGEQHEDMIGPMKEQKTMGDTKWESDDPKFKGRRDKVAAAVGNPILKLRKSFLKYGSLSEMASAFSKKAFTKILKFTSFVISAIKKTLIYGAIVLGVLFLLYRVFKNAGVREKLADIWDDTKAFFNNYILPWLVVIWDGIGDIVKGFQEGKFFLVLEGIMKIVGGIIMVGLQVLSLMLQLVVRVIVDSFMGLVNWLFDSSVSLTKKLVVLGYIASALIFLVAFFMGGWLIALAGAIVLALSYALEKFKLYADGGTTTSGLSVVGEKGPELVRLPTGSRVYSNANSQKMLTSSGGITNNITVQVTGRVGASDTEIRDIATKVSREINLRMNRTSSTVSGF
jgi:hypothetical protein